MKVFITWSGPKSKVVASALRDWIKKVLQNVHPWMSEHDIMAGQRWAAKLAAELKDTNFGIICLTKGNTERPWLLFESGALGKNIDGSHVCPYLIEMEQTDVPPGPLIQFQMEPANVEGTLNLVRAINSAQAVPLSDEQLKQTVELWWPKLKESLNDLPPEELATAEPARGLEEMAKETLEIVRELSRQAARDTRENLSSEAPDPGLSVNFPQRRPGFSGYSGPPNFTETRRHPAYESTGVNPILPLRADEASAAEQIEKEK